MGRREQTENYFGKRVKAERELRGWSQSRMAELLSANDIPMIHASTIAKIELGSRPTRIDEAIGIADLFGISLDALLGREGMEDESSHAMTVLADEAARLVGEITQVRERLHRAYRELATHFDFADFDERVSQGEKFQLRGLPLEQTRARLMWVHKNNALANAAALLDDLGTVAKIRTMSGPELGRQVKTDEVLAEIYRRAANEAATEYDTTEA
jgi:transcriptional regulator with XRE-family HTH domain